MINLVELRKEGWGMEDAKALIELEHLLATGYRGIIVSRAIKDHIARFGLMDDARIDTVKKTLREEGL